MGICQRDAGNKLQRDSRFHARKCGGCIHVLMATPIVAIYAYEQLNAHMFIHTHTDTMFSYTHGYTLTNTYIYIHMYTHICAHIHIHVHMYIHTCIDVSRHSLYQAIGGLLYLLRKSSVPLPLRTLGGISTWRPQRREHHD